jgi:transposase-like protein
MAVTCNKCGNGRFEMSGVILEGSAETVAVLRCADCGQTFGVSDGQSLRAALDEQQAVLNNLSRQMSEMREMLHKLSAPAQN